MTSKKKFVDDLTLMEAVQLNTSLTQKPIIIGPRNFDDVGDFNLLGENSILQHQLNDLRDYTALHKMKINEKKTKIMVFNMSQKKQFSPHLTLSDDGDPLEVIRSTRLLGTMVSNCLKWNDNVDDITARATKKLWILIRFKSIGANQQQLIKVYCSRIRMTLEKASPVFHSSLTQIQRKSIEMVQKKALSIILGREYVSYENALRTTNIPTLDVRREQHALNFALKCIASPKHAAMFPVNDVCQRDLRKKKPYLEPLCSTTRYYNSAIPAMTRMLNSHFSEAK